MNLNSTQVLAIILAVLSVMSGASAQLSDAGLAASTVKAVVGLSSLFATILAAVIATLTGQGAILKAVQAMPGIEKITVNARANSTMATLAVDDTQSKIEATPGAAAAVARTAAAAA